MIASCLLLIQYKPTCDHQTAGAFASAQSCRLQPGTVLFTEQQIQQSLAIAHRLSTLHQTDRILVFEKGKILEEGTHEQLLLCGGRYAQLWHMQTSEATPSTPLFS